MDEIYFKIIEFMYKDNSNTIEFLKLLGNYDERIINMSLSLEIINHSIDSNMTEILYMICDYYNRDIYELFYHIFTYCIKNSKLYIFTIVYHHYKEYISDSLKNTILLYSFKNEFCLDPMHVIRSLELIVINQYNIDYLLRRLLNNNMYFQTYNIFNNYVQSVENTDIVRVYINSYTCNQIIKNLIISKMIEIPILEENFKVFCKVFCDICHKDLIRYLIKNGVHEYNGTFIHSINHKLLAHLLNTGKLVVKY